VKLPDKLCRKAVKEKFNKLSNETWKYLSTTRKKMVSLNVERTAGE